MSLFWDFLQQRRLKELSAESIDLKYNNKNILDHQRYLEEKIDALSLTCNEQ